MGVRYSSSLAAGSISKLLPIRLFFKRRALGGDVTARDSISVPGPGHSASDRSLSVKFDSAAPDGFIVHSHAGDDWRECRDLVNAELGRETRAPSRPAAARPASIDGEGINGSRALAIWAEAIDPPGPLVEQHLASRGLTLPPDVDGHVIRYHPRLWHADSKRHMSGMVSLFRDILTDNPCGIHRTYLDGDGNKIGRKMLGRVNGAAIKLTDNADVSYGLHIGEGVETCIAGWLAGFRPVWALGSVGAIGKFPVLAAVDALTILGERKGLPRWMLK